MTADSVTDGNMAGARAAVISSQVAVQFGSSQALQENPVEVSFTLVYEVTKTNHSYYCWNDIDITTLNIDYCELQYVG